MPSPTTTTSVPTTVASTTTTTVVTRARTAPAVTPLTKRATVSSSKVKLSLRCGRALCKGTIELSLARQLLAARLYNLGAGRTGTFTLGFSKQAMNTLTSTKDHSANVLETVTVSGGRTVQVDVRVLSPTVSWAISGPTVAGVPIRFTYRSENIGAGGSLVVQQLLSGRWVTLVKLPPRSIGRGVLPALAAGTHRLRLAYINSSGTLDTAYVLVVRVQAMPPAS